MRKRSYRAYLRSNEWKRKREAARKRARGRCRVCGTTENLHTHHVTYKRLGNETQNDLMVLCKQHHFGCHAFIRTWKKGGLKPLSDYALTMKYVSRERAKLKKRKNKGGNL